MTGLPWPQTPPAYGGVVLRPFGPHDLPMVRDLATDDYVPLVSTLPKDADEDQSRAWLARQHQRLVDLTGYSFCIADAVSDAALGQIGLWPKDIDEGRASLGYLVAPRARGRHAAADALAALTQFAWTVDGLERLEAYVEPWNAASIRTVERAGFQREGLLRGRQVIGGTRRDMLLFARLRADGAVG